NYVFAPGKSAVRKSHFDIYNSKIKNKGADMMWPETKSFQTSYSMNYLLMNTESDEFIKYLEAAEIPTEESYDESLLNANIKKEKQYSYENYLAHRDYIKEKYCSEVVLSDDLREYMDELLKDCKTDYEKLRRIQQLLVSFNYTLTPGELPAYVDTETEFLDYFILEKREGYCNFFATAFVLLARAEGIPARYVQGYCTPTYSLSSIYITSSMAHAWAEVYFDGAGWIPFDSTPGFNGNTYWDTENLTISLYGYDKSAPPKYNYSSDPLPELPDEEEDDEDAIVLKWYMIAVPIAFGILIISLFFSLFRFIAKMRFKKLTYDRQFVIISRQIFAILKLLGRPMEEGETISEYYSRLSKEYPLSKLEFMTDLENYLYDKKDSEDYLKTVCEKTEGIRGEFLTELRHLSFWRFLRFYLKW
ncbi:MAG: transglutaminase-like domain-containing protein, partial [Lachnospiraceae bacterium]|nr:transglutaminase-like domain-containing protein [Lachnospiraceae bacterium]